jgi:hypothetical protein
VRGIKEQKGGKGCRYERKLERRIKRQSFCPFILTSYPVTLCSRVF